MVNQNKIFSFEIKRQAKNVFPRDVERTVDPDETAHYEPSHLDLRCLQKPIIIAYDSEIVKQMNIY